MVLHPCSIGLYHGTGRHKDVVNLSLGEYPITNCNTEIAGLRQTLLNAGKRHFIVMSAGNDSGDANLNLPGCISGHNLFTVGAVNCNLNCAGYSNFGAPVDYLAVGTDIFSTYLRDATTNVWTYRVVSGTSFSAAVISGVIHANNGIPKNGRSNRLWCASGPIISYHLGVRNRTYRSIRFCLFAHRYGFLADRFYFLHEVRICLEFREVRSMKNFRVVDPV